MSTWIDKEIQAWARWEHSARNGSTIPAHIQVGKFLAAADRDPAKARELILHQIQQDSMLESMSDNYFKRVLERLDFLLVNQLIVE
jgi:hypothetical protein